MLPGTVIRPEQTPGMPMEPRDKDGIMEIDQDVVPAILVTNLGENLRILRNVP